MSKSNTVLIAIGGGEFSESPEVLEAFLDLLKDTSDPTVTVMTVATDAAESAAKKYSALLRKHAIKHVSVIGISARDDAFDEKALKKVERADALFFTGGDQLNVTTLIGGSPLHQLIQQRVTEGFIIAGTSAGAMMMSNSMIISGTDDIAPKRGGVEIAPGMDLVSGTMIDTHFSERGRHGRLLTAVAHYPQDVGIGVDERTAVIFRGDEMEVVGEGVVTIMDGSAMHHSDLPYRQDGEPLGMFGVIIHVLPSGYRYHLKTREPVSAPPRKSPP